jgi:hypothetical protein
MAHRTIGDAVHVIGLTSFHLDLDGRMVDVKTASEISDDRAQDLLPFSHALFRDEDMATAGNDAGTDHPDMKIVNVEDTAN